MTGSDVCSSDLSFYKFTYLFLAALGLRCRARAFSSCGKRGLLLVLLTLFIYCYCFLNFYLVYFCSDLYDFFPPTNFGAFFFVLLSLVALGVRLDCLFEIFLVS